MTAIVGQILSHLEMSQIEGMHLQRGMNFRLHPHYSVILMSTRPGAPYNDQVLDEGRVLIYEGHDVPQKFGSPDPKSVDQPEHNSGGTLTQNGKFYNAAIGFKQGESLAENVKVYEKIREGIWVYNGMFHLVDAWRESDGVRSVFKFKLQLSEGESLEEFSQTNALEHTRIIPTSVKLEVWKRDQGQCVKCGSRDNLHFDHIIPYSKGGSSLIAKNIQLLCARHNLGKHDRIE